MNDIAEIIDYYFDDMYLCLSQENTLSYSLPKAITEEINDPNISISIFYQGYLGKLPYDSSEKCQEIMDMCKKNLEYKFDMIYMKDKNCFVKKDGSETVYLEDAYIDFFLQGFNLQERGLYQRAIEYYNKSIEEKPDCFQSWNNAGICYEKLGQFDKANACFLKTLIFKKIQKIQGS